MKKFLNRTLSVILASLLTLCLAVPGLAARKQTADLLGQENEKKFTISDVTVNSAAHPTGVDSSIYLGWILNSPEQNTNQTDYQIIVRDEQNKAVYNSGKIHSADSAYVPVKMSLKPMTDYTVRVTSWDNHGNKAQGSTTFSSGKVNSDWKGKWISPSGSYTYKSPDSLFRKTFDIRKPVKKAVLFSTALGCYVPFLNGKRASEDYFAPGYTQYDKRLQYNTYDLTNLILQGENTLITEVAPGWYSGRDALIVGGNSYGKDRALLEELHILYADGTEDVIATDDSWETSNNGPRRFTSFFDGETYDANYSITQGPWKKISLYRGKKPNIVENTGSPVRKGAVLPAKNLGNGIYDFGRNFAGIIHVKMKAPAGKKVHITHAELLQDGKMYTKNLLFAKAEVNYTTRAGEQDYEPLFTYMGFRYARIEPESGVEIEDVYGTELYSEMEKTGSFETSDSRINQLQKNIETSQKANFIDIPTDCPQRGERAGWTGDISIFAPTGAYNFNIDRIMTKWMTDVRESQQRNGAQSFIIPSPPKISAMTHTAQDSVWGDAVLYVPWAVYESTGNTSILSDNYNAMKKWVDYSLRLSRLGKQPYIWDNGIHFGDWLAPDTDTVGGMRRANYTSTSYLANSSKILSHIAKILGKESDARKYQEENQKVKDAYQKYLVKEDGHLKEDFQSAYVLALAFDMLTATQRPLALNDLVKNIEKNGNHLTTGFVGTPYLLSVLSDNGRKDKAYDLLFQDTEPSWLYEVESGATSIWEKWNAIDENGTFNSEANSSLNHYSYGCVGNWMYQNAAGIRPLSAGYKKIRIAPLMDNRLTHAQSSHKTPYGMVSVNWNRSGSHFTMTVQVPCNTTAQIVLPDGKTATVGSGVCQFACNIYS